MKLVLCVLAQAADFMPINTTNGHELITDFVSLFYAFT